MLTGSISVKDCKLWKTPHPAEAGVGSFYFSYIFSPARNDSGPPPLIQSRGPSWTPPPRRGLEGGVHKTEGANWSLFVLEKRRRVMGAFFGVRLLKGSF